MCIWFQVLFMFPLCWVGMRRFCAKCAWVLLVWMHPTNLSPSPRLRQSNQHMNKQRARLKSTTKTKTKASLTTTTKKTTTIHKHNNNSKQTNKKRVRSVVENASLGFLGGQQSILHGNNCVWVATGPFYSVIRGSGSARDTFCALLVCFCFGLCAACFCLVLCFLFCFSNFALCLALLCALLCFCAFGLYFASCLDLLCFFFVLCFVLLCFVL